jgi:L-lactate dehydrogenase (cytochrome)
VFKALALGARACLIGRPWAFALAAQGEAGVAHVLELYRRQMATTMVLAGCEDVAHIGTGMLA